MRSSSNSDPVSYWKTAGNGVDVSTITVHRSIPNRGTAATGNNQSTSLHIRGMYCAVAGNALLRYVEEDGTTTVNIDFTGLVAGAVYPFCPQQKVSGSATLIALYG